MKKRGCSFYMSKYTIGFKKKVVDFYKDNGQCETLRVYNISKTALRLWIYKSESDGFMRKKNKHYSVQEKLDIIAYYRENGVVETERKYNISNSIFYKWERILYEYGTEELGKEHRGRKPKGPKKDLSKDKDFMAELQSLRMENDYLKKLKALVEKREDQERKSK